MAKKSVLILMASYNGEKYIEEQIQSIIAQTFKNWTLWIQDDGSTDDTLDIISKYVRKDSRINLINNFGIHGPYYNFHSLINKAKDSTTYDYYMFCDHDDVWDREKIEKMIKTAIVYNMDTPIMIYANMKIINDKGDIIEEDVNKKLRLKCEGDWDLFYNHRVYGCNSLFNHALLEIAPKVDVSEKREITAILSHDNYYAKFAEVCGKLIYLDEITMSYRRYGKNVTAAQNYDYGIKRIIKRINDIDSLAKDHARTYSQSLYTIDEMIREKRVSKNDKKILCQIYDSLCKGGFSACKCFLKNKVSCGVKIRTLSRFVILASGIYKKYLVY